MKTIVTGIVVKVSEDEIVLLKNDGSFKNVKRPKNEFPLIGETYSTKISVNSDFRWSHYLSLASIILISVIISQLIIDNSSDGAYLVAVDINPSIEIKLDEDFKVIDYKANNTEGEKVINSLSSDQQFRHVIQELNSTLVQMGYVRESEQVTIVSTVLSLDRQNEQSTKKIEENITNHLANKSTELTVLHGSQEDYDEAKKVDMTINEYVLGKQLKRDHKIQRIENASDQSMDELVKQLTNDTNEKTRLNRQDIENEKDTNIKNQDSTKELEKAEQYRSSDENKHRDNSKKNNSNAQKSSSKASGNESQKGRHPDDRQKNDGHHTNENNHVDESKNNNSDSSQNGKVNKPTETNNNPDNVNDENQVERPDQEEDKRKNSNSRSNHNQNESSEGNKPPDQKSTQEEISDRDEVEPNDSNSGADEEKTKTKENDEQSKQEPDTDKSKLDESDPPNDGEQIDKNKVDAKEGIDDSGQDS